MAWPPYKPLARLKRDVRECVEERLGRPIRNLTPSHLDLIRSEVDELRRRYRSRSRHPWKYGESNARLVAYALAYYPYHVELVPEALAAFPALHADRGWDLKSTRAARGRAATTRHALVGCGAAPELYGLLRYLAQNLYLSGIRDRVAPNLEVTLYEPEHHQWKPVFDAVTSRLIERNRWLAAAIQTGDVRIRWSPAAAPIPHLDLGCQYDFILLQLVLNELPQHTWLGWLAQAREECLAPGGVLCVIDTDASVHDALAGSLGFQRSSPINLEWGESELRKLDAQTTACLFPGPDIHGGAARSNEHEKHRMTARASFFMKPAYRTASRERRSPRQAPPTPRAQPALRACVHCGAPIPRANGRAYCDRHAG